MCFAMLLVVALLGVVSAENTSIDSNIGQENATLPEPGTDTVIENIWDRVRLAFTFNQEKKIQKALDIAEERLAEAEANAETNPERAEIARKRYEHFAQKAEDTLAKLQETQNGDNATESFGELARVENRFELHNQRAIMAHNQILERMQKGNMSQEQVQKIAGIFQRFENKSMEMQQKMQQKRENLETKFKVRNEMTDEEFAEFKEQVRENREEKAKERIKQRINQSEDDEEIDLENESEDEEQEISGNQNAGQQGISQGAQ